jgi:hypothetical protein
MTSDEEIAQIGRLRYSAYRIEQAIDEREDGMFLDRFDKLSNCYNLGVFVCGELAAAMRIHVLTADSPQSPSMEAFPEVLIPPIAAGKVVTDPNRFVADYEMSRANPALPYVCVRLPFLATEYVRGNFSIATVRKEHEAFYSRITGCKRLVAPRPYPLLTKCFGLMVMDFEADGDRVYARYPFFRSTAAEREQIFGPQGNGSAVRRCYAA